MFDRLFGDSVLAAARPDSLIDGVQIGTITYSYRSMPDQSAEAILKYVVDSGISAIELMGAPVESYLGAPSRGGGPGRAGAGGGRGRGGPGRRGAAPDPATLTSEWNGVPCAPAQEGGGRGPGGPGGGRGRGGRGATTPEEQAAAKAAADEHRKWYQSVSMDQVKALRKMYNDAGVSIYAVKMLSTSMSDDEVEWVFNVAEALGCTQTTLELTDDVAQLKRLGDFGLKHKIYVAYHTHLQGSMTAFDAAFAASKGNMANVDFGHYVAGGGGNPVLFLEKFHDRIASFHLKDRTTPAHCALNLPWGTGETPNQGAVANRPEEQVDDAGGDRAGIQHPARVGRREGSHQVPGLLQGRPRVRDVRRPSRPSGPSVVVWPSAAPSPAGEGAACMLIRCLVRGRPPQPCSSSQTFSPSSTKSGASGRRCSRAADRSSVWSTPARWCRRS